MLAELARHCIAPRLQVCRGCHTTACIPGDVDFVLSATGRRRQRDGPELEAPVDLSWQVGLPGLERAAMLRAALEHHHDLSLQCLQSPASKLHLLCCKCWTLDSCNNNDLGDPLEPSHCLYTFIAQTCRVVRAVPEHNMCRKQDSTTHNRPDDIRCRQHAGTA